MDTLTVEAQTHASPWTGPIVVLGFVLGLVLLAVIICLPAPLMTLVGLLAGLALGALWYRGSLRAKTRSPVRLTPTRLEVGRYSYTLDGLRGLDWDGVTLRVHLADGSIEHHARTEDDAARNELVSAVRRQVAGRGDRDDVPDALASLRAAARNSVEP